MQSSTLEQTLSSLPLGALRYFDSISSTNDEALRWAETGAPHLALVVADEQTAGRGRLGRRWYTPPGSALALSLVLRPESLPAPSITRLTALGALAVCNALQEHLGLDSQIKWPNDVLAGGRKLAGVLVEIDWQGDQPTAAILGIGINIAPESVPAEHDLLFPATCVETELGIPVTRWELLEAILRALLGWLPHLDSAEFLAAWETRLAYQGKTVQVYTGGKVPLEGQLLGLESDGALRLRLPSGEIKSIQAGELHMRPAGFSQECEYPGLP
jgi:BirA family biotin operon repressor/biotin-[acetyl-CoA-carboxylase] ligase